MRQAVNQGVSSLVSYIVIYSSTEKINGLVCPDLNLCLPPLDKRLFMYTHKNQRGMEMRPLRPFPSFLSIVQRFLLNLSLSHTLFLSSSRRWWWWFRWKGFETGRRVVLTPTHSQQEFSRKRIHLWPFRATVAHGPNVGGNVLNESFASPHLR